MKRWMNGLPGATQRLGAMMNQRGLSASQPWMRADTHHGPERKRSTSKAEYIDAALTFVALRTPSCTARPGHTFWHNSAVRHLSERGLLQDFKQPFDGAVHTADLCQKLPLRTLLLVRRG